MKDLQHTIRSVLYHIPDLRSYIVESWDEHDDGWKAHFLGNLHLPLDPTWTPANDMLRQSLPEHPDQIPMEAMCGENGAPLACHKRNICTRHWNNAYMLCQGQEPVALPLAHHLDRHGNPKNTLVCYRCRKTVHDEGEPVCWPSEDGNEAEEPGDHDDDDNFRIIEEVERDHGEDPGTYKGEPRNTYANKHQIISPLPLVTLHQ